jgi:hypothetical protein
MQPLANTSATHDKNRPGTPTTRDAAFERSLVRARQQSVAKTRPVAIDRRARVTGRKNTVTGFT